MHEKTEQSTIDYYYYILCERMDNYLESMHIDDEREFMLKHTVKKRKENDYVKSDHNVMFCSFELTLCTQIPKTRRELFNMKCIDGTLVSF